MMSEITGGPPEGYDDASGLTFRVEVESQLDVRRITVLAWRPERVCFGVPQGLPDYQAFDTCRSEDKRTRVKIDHFKQQFRLQYRDQLHCEKTFNETPPGPA